MTNESDYLDRVLEYLYPIEDKFETIPDILKKLSIPDKNNYLADRLYETLTDNDWVHATIENKAVLINSNGRLYVNKKRFHIKSEPSIGTQNIMRDNYGNSNQSGQGSSFSNDFINPIKQTNINSKPAKPPKTSIIEKLSWLIGIIIGLITLYEFILKKLFH